MLHSSNFCINISKLGWLMKFLADFFLNNIDIHKWNLISFQGLKFVIQNSL
jgi:hypothetical protein